MISKPFYDKTKGKWTVEWGRATFRFNTFDAAHTFYLYNEDK